MPTKSPGLMSPTDAAVTPITLHSGLSANAAFGPSRVLTVRVDPSRLAIVPRTRTVSSACAGRVSAIAMKAAIAAAPVAEIDLGFIVPTLRWCRTPLTGGLARRPNPKPSGPCWTLKGDVEKLEALLAAERERADKAIAAFEALARRLEAMAEARRPAWWRWLRFAD
jgi:hypothetical protein